ncbi:MAG TPA: TerC family protein [Steroidobacteraceae bacterium]|jgi:predicted tellurium resistance membrane protein TerC|nr:TerC family protein [Steroidobacteraceae bacterium]
MKDIFDIFTEPANWAAIVALIAMEIVLGIDNLMFVSIVTNKVPEQNRARARRIGIGLALGLRLVLLSLIAFIVTLTRPLFMAFNHGFSWRDLILISGGLFLVWKATTEIHHHVDSSPALDMFNSLKGGSSFSAAIMQIIALDLVFSIDSIVTAVGMTNSVPIMFLAVIVAVSLMLTAAGPLSRFMEKNPTVLLLALSFLMMIGMALIADGFGIHIPKGYIYAAMGFSVFVEGLNIRARRTQRRRAARH